MGARWEPAVDPNENLGFGRSSNPKEVQASAARVIDNWGFERRSPLGISFSWSAILTAVMVCCLGSITYLGKYDGMTKIWKVPFFPSLFPTSFPKKQKKKKPTGRRNALFLSIFSSKCTRDLTMFVISSLPSPRYSLACFFENGRAPLNGRRK